MPTKIYHPKQGFVLTGDDNEVKEILSRGGVLIPDSMSLDDIKRVINPQYIKEEVAEVIEIAEEPKPQEIVKQRGRPKKWP